MTTPKLERILCVDTNKLNAKILTENIKDLAKKEQIKINFSWVGSFQSAYNLVTMKKKDGSLVFQDYSGILLARDLNEGHSGGTLAIELNFLDYVHKLPKVVYPNVASVNQKPDEDKTLIPDYIPEANILFLRNNPTAENLLLAIKNPKSYYEACLKSVTPPKAHY